jgi:hypothetical protein
MILFISLHQILFLIPPGRSNVMSSFNVQHFSFAMVNEVQILLMLLQSSQLVMELCTTIAREFLEPYVQLGLSILTGGNVKYRARLKSDRSPAGSDRVRRKGLGFNL